MSDNTSTTNENSWITVSGFETQPPEIKSLAKASVNNMVSTWISKLNQLISISNVVMNKTGRAESDITAYPFYKFGFMSADDKVYLDYLSNFLNPTTSDFLNPITIGNNETLSVYSALVDTTNLVSKCHNRFVKTYTLNSGSDNVITINHDTNDVVVINSSIELNLNFNAGTGSPFINNKSSFYGTPNSYDLGKMYSEKIICINAIEDIVINYVNSENNWHFVNNGIHPNVGISVDIKESTFLKKDNMLVLKFILIGNKVLISVIDNTQLVDNYENPDYNEKYPE